METPSSRREYVKMEQHGTIEGRRSALENASRVPESTSSKREAQGNEHNAHATPKQRQETDTFFDRSTFPRHVEPTARARLAKSTHSIKSHNTKPARYETTPNESYHVLTPLGLSICSGKAKIRPQTVRLWWSDEACVPQEGEDNQESRVEIGVHTMQD